MGRRLMQRVQMAQRVIAVCVLDEFTRAHQISAVYRHRSGLELGRLLRNADHEANNAGKRRASLEQKCG